MPEGEWRGRILTFVREQGSCDGDELMEGSGPPPWPPSGRRGDVHKVRFGVFKCILDTMLAVSTLDVVGIIVLAVLVLGLGTLMWRWARRGGR